MVPHSRVSTGEWYPNTGEWYPTAGPAQGVVPHSRASTGESVVPHSRASTGESVVPHSRVSTGEWYPTAGSAQGSGTPQKGQHRGVSGTPRGVSINERYPTVGSALRCVPHCVLSIREQYPKVGPAACFDYMISDSNLDLKDSDNKTLQDTLAHDDVPPYND